MGRLEVELDKLYFLRGSGHDYICENCNYVYRKKPIIDGIEICEQCGGKNFISIDKRIKALEEGIII